MPALRPANAGTSLVLRPRLGRWVPEVLSGVIVLADLAMVVSLPWDLLNRAGVLAIGLGIGVVLHRLGDVRLVADDAGILVVNPRLRRRLDYAEVVALSLEPAAPWLVLDLSDGSTMSAMAVQGSEGDYARVQVQALRAWLARSAAG